jgi:hypothetical protein
MHSHTPPESAKVKLMSSIMRCRSGLIVVEDGDAGLIEVGVMDVAPVGVTSVMGYSCLNKVVDPVIFRQEPTSRYSPRITPSTPLARSALPRERFRSLNQVGPRQPPMDIDRHTLRL